MLTRRFIKLGNTILNTNSIQCVTILPKEFYIELNPNGGPNGFVLMGTGFLRSRCVKKHLHKHTRILKNGSMK